MAWTVLGSGRLIKPQMALFLAWGSSSWLGGKGTQHMGCQGHPVQPLLCCYCWCHLAGPCTCHWLSLSLCRPEMEETVCGECAGVWGWGWRGACVPASFPLPYPQMRSVSNPLLIQHPSPVPWPLQIFTQLPGEPEAHDSPREQDGPWRSHGLGRRV